MFSKKFLFLPIFLFLFINQASAQPTDLCGIWLAKSYQCFTVGAGGILTLYYKDEVILITQNGALTTATKLTGDSCVTAGQKTWEGMYTSNPFGVTLTAGSPSAPGNSQGPGTVDVKDSSHLELGSIRFTKLSCKQIDSLQVPLDSLNNRCSKCEIKKPDVPKEEMIPNVFTPNKDGVNDSFLPKVKERLSSSELRVYNRWGNTVFKTTELYKSWDGQSDGGACDDGIYFWIYTYTDDTQQAHTLKGFVTVFR